MKALRIAPEARRDLTSIWDYTEATRGRERADDYVARLHSDMDRLRAFTDIGAPHMSSAGTFRKMASGHHLIFYQSDNTRIRIVRILHERMDTQTKF